MKKKLLAISSFLLLILSLSQVHAISLLEIGALQVPIFIPRGGYLSESGFPIAIRNLDINPIPFAGLSGTLQMYSLRGLASEGLPTEGPLMGPSFTLVGNICLKLMLPLSNFRLTIKGGGFSFYQLSPPLLKGNLDRGVAADEGWDTATTKMEFQNRPGLGYTFGGGITYSIAPEGGGLFVELLYYNGRAPLELTGTITGGKEGDIVVNKETSYAGSVLFSGWELTFGLVIEIFSQS